MPRVTIKDLQAQVAMCKRESRTLKAGMTHAKAEHEKTRQHLSDQIAHLRAALRNEEDNVQALRRLMNESGHRKAGVSEFCANPPLLPPLHPMVPARTIPTHLL